MACKLNYDGFGMKHACMSIYTHLSMYMCIYIDTINKLGKKKKLFLIEIISGKMKINL